jgi:hypothetical protein
MAGMVLPAVAFAFTFAWVVPALGSGEVLFQSRQTILFNRAHPSIVYLEVSDGKEGAGCTGAVVASSGSESTIMTAAHCVEGMRTFQVFLHEDVSHPYPASVVKVGSSRGADVAFLHVNAGGVPALSVASKVDVGANVVIIGYPRAAMADFHDRHVLVARQDQTAIASVVPRANGLPQIINYQYAVTDHGDSGAPVIELECGCIVGVVKGEYDPDKVGRTDFAMGPQEIWDIATSGSPKVALTRVGGPAPTLPTNPVVVTTPRPLLPMPAPSRVAYVPPVVRSPLPGNHLPVEALLVVPGPPTGVQWTGWRRPIELNALPGVHAQVRCAIIGRENLWQVQAINEGTRKVSFRYRLSDAGGNSLDAAVYHPLDNDGAYLFRPQQLAVPCPNGTVYHQVTDVSYLGDPKPPAHGNLVVTSVGPPIRYHPWGDWGSSRQLTGVRIAFRCIELGDNWFGWELAFSNRSGNPYVFDFDIEPRGVDPSYRHRYTLPASSTFYYSDVIAVGSNGDCARNDVTMWAAI